MKIAGMLVVLAMAAAGAVAQDKQAILEACAAVKDAEKRATCFEQVARLGLPPTQQASSAEDKLRAKYMAVGRAFVALESATGAGVTYQQYLPLVHAAATEVSLIRGSPANETEARAISMFEQAVNAYADAGKWWQADIDFYSRGRNRTAYGFGLPFNMLGMDAFVNRYSMPVGKADLLGIQRGVPTSLALHAIWQSGGTTAQRGIALVAESAKASTAVAPAAATQGESGPPAMADYTPPGSQPKPGATP